MNMNTQIHFQMIKRSLCAVISGALIALLGIGPVSARDTDVYLMSPTVARDDSPNVMIVQDNSGSMDTVISSTRPAYDPSINYCTADLNTLYPDATNPNGGKPGNCASISGRIYWSFNNTPPANNSSDWFTSSKNKCQDSTSALNNSGFYGGTKIARWHDQGSNSNKNWKTLNSKTDTDITYVDCQADGTTSGLVAGDNTFPKSTTSAPAYTSTANQAFNWSNFTSNATPTLYTSNYMNYSNNAALLITLTRLDVAKNAIKAIIDGNKSIRFGLTVFNDDGSLPDGGRVLMRIETMDDARRTLMKNTVDSLTASTYTPLAETMWEVYRYFAGLTVTYGNPSPLQSPQQDSCAQNVTSAYCASGKLYRATNGQYSNSSGAILSGAPVNAAYNTGTYISPFKFGCQTAYVIYVTDGDPTNDTAADTKIKALSGVGSCDSPSCLDELAGWMHNNDVYSGLPGKQVVNTYTIGFGGGISASGLALLQQAAAKGGGKYYTADNSDQLSASLQGAITEILAANASFTAPSLSVNAFNKLYNRDDVYFALFKPSSSAEWDGNVKRFKLCTSSDSAANLCTFGEVVDKNTASAIDSQTSKIKDTAVSYWGSIQDGQNVTMGGAGAKITDNTKVPRTLYTYRGSYAGLSSSAPATPVAIVATGGNSVYTAAVATPTILGLPATATSTDVTNLINWMRGQDAYDVNGNTNTTETRTWNFADPLHSKPVSITYGAELTAGVPDPTKPIVKLFVGNNDGTLRIINRETGVEEWAFIPNEMLSSQYNLAQDADQDHIYGLDDSPVFWVNDYNNDGVIDPTANPPEFVYMYIGMRRGGRNIYAFDVTPTTKMTLQTQTITPKLMWVIQGGSGSFTKLGQTWSTPKIARIRYLCSGSVCDDGNPNTDDSQSRMVLMFGGGYDTNQDNSIPSGPDSMGNAIYIVDPKTGQRIWWASSDPTSTYPIAKMNFSIPSELTLMDTNGDKSVDRIYVGDTGGQIFRIDLGTTLTSASNGGSSGYVFADAGCDSTSATSRVHDNAGACTAGATNQGRRKFFYPPDVVPVDDPTYSTSSLYNLVTIASGDREDPLDLLTTNLSPVQEAVHNRVYAFRDYDYKTGAPAVAATTVTDTVMYDASANLLGTLTGTSLTNEINNNVKSSKGWFIDLKEANNVALTNGLTTKWVGEKSLAKTVVYGGVLYVTTFVPANDSTAANTCQANEGEGRYYALDYLSGAPGYDLNGDGSLDRFAVVGGGIPSEVIIVIRDGGVTGLVGASGGATQTKVNSKIPIFKTYWYEE